FSDLQVNNHQLSQQVSTLQAHVTEIDARLDALSIDFDKEMYPHMLTAIAELRQAFNDVMSAGIVKGMSEGLKYGVEHGEAKLDLAAIKVYDPEAEAKYVTALTALRDLNDSGEDVLEWICELRPDTS
ncbi:gypsy type transposase, partial [Tanacetum coccineum]